MTRCQTFVLSAVELIIADFLARIEMIFQQAIATLFVTLMSPTKSHLWTLPITAKFLITSYFLGVTFALALLKNFRNCSHYTT